MIERFLETQRVSNMSTHTIRRRRQTLTRFEREAVPLADATVDDVEAWIGARKEPTTRQALLGDLRAFYSWAVERGKLTNDPTAGIGKIKIHKRMPRPVPADMLALAIDEARPKLRVTLMLGAYAGLRVSEIAALRWEDINFETGKLWVRNGKGGKDRLIKLNAELAQRLTRFPRRPDGFVIGTQGATVSSVIRRHFDRYGINYRPHDLRAAFATDLAEKSNGNVMLVAHQLGHGSVATTERYMAHVPDGSDAIDRLHKAS